MRSCCGERTVFCTRLSEMVDVTGDAGKTSHPIVHSQSNMPSFSNFRPHAAGGRQARKLVFHGKDYWGEQEDKS